MISSEFPWATFGVVVLTSVIAIVGGGVVIWGHPGALSFDDYVNAMWKFAAAIGLLGVGRGVKAGLENQNAGSGSNLSDVSLLSDLPGLISGLASGGQQPAADGQQTQATPVEIVPHV